MGEFGHFIETFEQRTANRDALQPLLELIIEQSHVGIIVADAAGVLLTFNAEAERQHGKGLLLVPAEEWIRTYGLMHPDGSPLRLEDLAMYRALRGERVEHFSYRLRTAGGDERVIVGNANPLRHKDGRIAGAVVITRDETEYHRATAQLQSSRNALWRANDFKGQLISNSADCLLAIDVDGSVTRLNTLAPSLLELRDGEDLPPWREFWPGKRSRQAAEAALTQALCGQVARFEGRTEFTSGQSRWWSAMLCPFRDENQRVDSVFAALRDITHLKKVEEESRQRATFAQQLMGIVSHDLRNPIGAILLSAGQLKRRADIDDKARRALDRMIWSAQRANRLIYDLLDFTQAQLQGGLRINRRWVNVHDVAQRVVDELRAANPGRAIALELRGDPLAEIDSDRISQVMTNLVANALQYGPEKVPVQIEIAGGEDNISIRVHNAGAAIDPGLLPRLFSPMQRGDGSDIRKRSIGLGLYIVKLVAQAHGGEATVRSSASGTDFVTVLPRRSADDAIALRPM